MSNFKRMHIIAGSFAIFCLVWQFPDMRAVFDANWQRGIGFIGGVALGGYMFGCVFGLLVNLVLSIFRRGNKVINAMLLTALGIILLVFFWKVGLKIYYLYIN